MLTKEEALNIDISKLKKVHLIGITSGFNSFCANYLINQGIEVTASEINQDSDNAKEWIKKGVLYPGVHKAEYIKEDLDLVVYPNGPIPGNPECEKTEELGIPAITIGQLTGLISKNFKTIAIAGTHGKTTTTALTVWMLKNAFGQLPNFVVGDEICGINKSWNYNEDSNYLVLEACEYKRQFLDRAPTPYISVITNIELDHTDYYKDQDDYNSAFSEFISNTTYRVVIDESLKNSIDVLNNGNVKVGVEVIDVQDIKEEYRDIKNPLSGEHNRENLLRVCGVAKTLGINIDVKDFPGVSSRFEFKGETVNGMNVYMDYSHNPKKIKACLQGAREKYPDQKIIFVWQPHSLERTHTFKEDFAKSLSNADIVLIPNIFVPTREKGLYVDLINEEEFVEYLKDMNPELDVRFTDGFENTKDILLDEEFDDRYVTVLASAGDLKNVLPMLNLEK